MRTVWLNGALVPAERAALPITSPVVRWGDGLFETMRADAGRVRFLDAHLDRLLASASALDLPVASREELSDAVAAVRSATDRSNLRIRLTAGPGLVLAEAEPIPPLGVADPVTAAVVAGAWIPGRAMGEHKSVSYGHLAHARRRARAVGADLALLADDAGRLGEADRGNLVAAVEGELITPPVEGILPGIARGALIAAGAVREGVLSPEVMDAATELLMTNAVQGVVALATVAEAPWSGTRPGPLAREAQRVFTEAGESAR